ncbi:helix-turn-helix transcriptional regulator [Janibacter melonis]|uniref:helix-turn-helix transcriptional regulator n=1 Tax=Janibacter melonis TaxID=262209 RepID=UPI001CD27A5F|nr:helix-turn-helix transcriptional regulator [Janibacter melonis]MCB5991739.1 helix-turn-helix transcriptional regulator [Janibacter melonis]
MGDILRTLDFMGNRPEVREFLMSRREKVTPEQVGLPVYGSRRVSGLRRGEVAALAGVSVEYYTRLERGNLTGVSDSVLESISRALLLDDTERSHLANLARVANTSSSRKGKRPASPPEVPPIVRRIVDAMPTLPAFVQNNRFDVLHANLLGHALYSDMFEEQGAPVNTVRFVFLSPVARRFYADWETVARTAVGALRVEAGKDPFDTELSNLIGELSTRSDAFRVMWGSNDVGTFRDGVKRLRHPVVGELELEHETLPVPGSAKLSITVYSPKLESPSEDGLTLLANWSLTSGDEKLDAAEITDDSLRD